MAHYPAPVATDPSFNTSNFGAKTSVATGSVTSTLNFGSFQLDAASLIVSGQTSTGTLSVSGTNGLLLAAPGTGNVGPISQAGYSWGLIAEGQVSSTASATTFFTFPATPTGVYFYQLCVKCLSQDAAALYYLSADPASASKYSLANVLHYGTNYPTVTFSSNALQVTTGSNYTVQYSLYQM